MIVDFKFDIGQTVYYKLRRGPYSDATVEQGTIQGLQIRKGGRIGVDFKQYNNVPIELVSDNKDEIQAMVDEFNAIPTEERWQY